MSEAKEASAPPQDRTAAPGAGRNGKRANDLGGKEWTRWSVSVWSDIKKDAEELALGHPAVYPKALVRRCLECFTRADERVVLDPFSGSGSTLLAALQAGKMGIGFEVNPDYVALTHRRAAELVAALPEEAPRGSIQVVQTDARALEDHLQPASVDICITSPPYWNILTQRRTADAKPTRHYGDREDDLGRIIDYHAFIGELVKVFAAVLTALKPGGYCVVNVMDLRKGPTFYPFHADLAGALAAAGYRWDDLIVWDRRAEYNHMRPLGYPAVFRINKAHEFVLIMQKPGG
jgi:DNA modification methylase